MRRLLASALVLLSASCLFATIFRSNQLQQELEVLDKIPESGYFLDVKEDATYLGLNGKVVGKTTSTVLEDGLLVVEENLVEESITTRQYKDGLLVRESISDSDGVRESRYGYMDGHLAFCSTYLDGSENPDSVVFFLRSSDDGALVAVRDGESLRFVSETYLFETGNLYQILSSDLVLNGDFSVQEDGSIIYEESGLTYVYDHLGRLAEVRSENEVTTYYYIEDRLSHTEKVVGGKRIVESYEDGKAVEALVYENDVLASRTQYMEGGNVQTLYRDGRTIATVYYNEDNRTVKEIVYN